MKGMKVLMVIGGLFLIIGIIGLMFTFQSEKKTVMKEIELSTEEFNDMSIDTTNAEVAFVFTNEKDPKVTLSGTVSGSYEETLDAEITDGKLQIEQKERQSKLYALDFGRNKLVLTVTIPKKPYQSLSISTLDGKISLQDAEIDTIFATIRDGGLEMENIIGSKLTMDSSDGMIKGSNLQIDELNATAGDGMISLSHIEAKQVETKIKDGKIKLDDIAGELVSEANDGSISLKTADLERSMALEVDDGSIIIDSDHKPENVEFAIDVSDGTVDLFGTYQGSTVIGNGDHLIKLSVHDGAIKVK